MLWNQILPFRFAGKCVSKHWRALGREIPLSPQDFSAVGLIPSPEYAAWWEASSSAPSLLFYFTGRFGWWLPPHFPQSSVSLIAYPAPLRHCSWACSTEVCPSPQKKYTAGKEFNQGTPASIFDKLVISFSSVLRFQGADHALGATSATATTVLYSGSFEPGTCWRPQTSKRPLLFGSHTL